MKNISILFLIVSWVFQIVSAYIIGNAGFMKLLSNPSSLYVFEQLGSGTGLMMSIGVLEVISAVLLLLPRVNHIGALLSFGTMIGALIAHVSRLGVTVNGDDGAMLTQLVIVFISSFVVLYIRRRSLPLIGYTFD